MFNLTMKFAVILAVIAIISSAFVIGVGYLVVTPSVSYSWSTKECVSVDTKGSCDNLPDKYVIRWVQ